MKAVFYKDFIYKYTPVWWHISWLLEQSTSSIIYFATHGLFVSILYLNHDSKYVVNLYPSQYILCTKHRMYGAYTMVRNGT